MGFRESTVRSNVRNGYCFFVVSVDIRQDRFGTIQILCMILSV